MPPSHLPRLRTVLLVGVLLLAARELAGLSPSTPLAHARQGVLQEGLPQNSVHAVLQRSDGYVFIATYEGLVRYSGRDVRVYDRSTAPGLLANGIFALAEDSRGRIVAATAGGGLALLEGDRFRTLGPEQGLPGKTVYALWKCRDGSILAGTDKGLVRLRGNLLEKVPGAAPLDGRAVRAVLERRDGSLVIGTEDRGHLFLANGVLRSPGAGEESPHTNITALAEEEDGTLWVGAYGGLASYRDGVRKAYGKGSGLPVDLIWSLLPARGGGVFVGTDTGGLVRIQGDRIERGAGALRSNFIRCLYEDREGTLWAGSNTGVTRLSDPKVVVFEPETGLSFSNVRTLTRRANGTVLVGGEGGVDVLSGDDLSPLPLPGPLPNTYVRAVVEDRKGVLWIGTNGGGLVELEGGRMRVHKESDGLASSVVNALITTRDGMLWVGCHGSGLSRWDGRAFKSWGTKDGLPHVYVRTLLEEDAGTLLVGTDLGLARFDGERFTRLFVEEFGEDDVFALVMDSAGVLWIGAENGLRVVRDGRIFRLTAKDGLPFEKVFSILHSGDDVWFAGNRGVFRAGRKELLAALSGGPAIAPEVFGKEEGMPVTQTNGATWPTGVEDGRGRLIFPTQGGAVAFDPKSIARNRVPPLVAIESVLVDGTRVPAASAVSAASSGAAAITIASGTEKIEIRYDGLSFVNPRNVRFRHRLVGRGDTFGSLGPERSVVIGSLRPGSYVFEVLAANDDGVLSTSPARLAVTVVPAFHETWWFRALAVLSLLLLGGLFQQARLRTLRARQRELERIVAERTQELSRALGDAETQRAAAVLATEAAEEANRAKSAFLANTSHELRTPLNAILGYAEILREDASAEGRSQAEADLARIHGAGEHLLALINAVLDLSKVEAGRMELDLQEFDLGTELERVVELAEPLAAKKGNTLAVDVPAGLGLVRLDPTKLRQVLLNLLSNASKFTEKGTISLVVAAGESDFVVTLRDTGIGMTAAELSRVFQPFVQADASTTRKYGGTGLGLVLAKRFVEMMSGTIQVSSEKGRGSEFVVRLPRRLDRRRTPSGRLSRE
ncbi:MAG: hypothetical protein JNK60_16100 [Acidobacteria bacterium]|nr:hypothetical protein [Acidobacteriota bacterium]